MYLYITSYQGNKQVMSSYKVIYSVLNFDFEVCHPRCVSNKSKRNVYAICRQTQLSTRRYANLLNI